LINIEDLRLKKENLKSIYAKAMMDKFEIRNLGVKSIN